MSCYHEVNNQLILIPSVNNSFYNILKGNRNQEFMEKASSTIRHKFYNQ